MIIIIFSHRYKEQSMDKTQPSKTLIRIKMEIQVNLPIADIPVTQTFLWNGWNTDRTLKKTSN